MVINIMTNMSLRDDDDDAYSGQRDAMHGMAGGLGGGFSLRALFGRSSAQEPTIRNQMPNISQLPAYNHSTHGTEIYADNAPDHTIEHAMDSASDHAATVEDDQLPSQSQPVLSFAFPTLLKQVNHTNDTHTTMNSHRVPQRDPKVVTTRSFGAVPTPSVATTPPESHTRPINPIGTKSHELNETVVHAKPSVIDGNDSLRKIQKMTKQLDEYKHEASKATKELAEIRKENEGIFSKLESASRALSKERALGKKAQEALEQERIKTLDLETKLKTSAKPDHSIEVANITAKMAADHENELRELANKLHGSEDRVATLQKQLAEVNSMNAKLVQENDTRCASHTEQVQCTNETPFHSTPASSSCLSVIGGGAKIGGVHSDILHSATVDCCMSAEDRPCLILPVQSNRPTSFLWSSNSRAQQVEAEDMGAILKDAQARTVRLMQSRPGFVM